MSQCACVFYAELKGYLLLTYLPAYSFCLYGARSMIVSKVNCFDTFLQTDYRESASHHWLMVLLSSVSCRLQVLHEYFPSNTYLQNAAFLSLWLLGSALGHTVVNV